MTNSAALDIVEEAPAGSVSERVAEQLLSRIASGALPPGARLPGERQLAEELGVSRVSIRAALQKLKTQGFLSAVQGGGTRVISSVQTIDPALAELCRVNLENLHDLAEIRAILEEWAVRRAALSAKPEQLAEMAGILERMTQAETTQAEDDVAFHIAIAKASGSGIYLHIVGVIRGILSEMLAHHRTRMFASPEYDAMILEQHQGIFAAIRDRDPDRAALCMRAHLAYVIERYRKERERREAEAAK